MVQVLKKLGSQHVLVVHADDGLDEISIGAATQVAELKNGRIKTYSIEPEQFGFAREPLKKLAVKTPAASLAMMKSVFDGKAGPARDIVALNAGAAIYAANLTSDLKAGVERASVLIESGEARQKLDRLFELSRSFL